MPAGCANHVPASASSTNLKPNNKSPIPRTNPVHAAVHSRSD
jgi:hypothetical protein